MKKSKNTLKTYFETGDKPTQGQFEDLIDSLVHVDDIPVVPPLPTNLSEFNNDVPFLIESDLPDLSKKADLVNGLVPTNQLPSYVDDVIEVANITAETTGETGKIYVDLSTNKQYRWSGSTFVEVGKDTNIGNLNQTLTSDRTVEGENFRLNFTNLKRFETRVIKPSSNNYTSFVQDEDYPYSVIETYFDNTRHSLVASNNFAGIGSVDFNSSGKSSNISLYPFKIQTSSQLLEIESEKGRIDIDGTILQSKKLELLNYLFDSYSDLGSKLYILGDVTTDLPTGTFIVLKFVYGGNPAQSNKIINSTFDGTKTELTLIAPFSQVVNVGVGGLTISKLSDTTELLDNQIALFGGKTQGENSIAIGEGTEAALSSEVKGSIYTGVDATPTTLSFNGDITSEYAINDLVTIYPLPNPDLQVETPILNNLSSILKKN